MFDTATCTAALDRWAAWQQDAELHAGGYGDLSDPPGPELAGVLHQWEPDSRADEELIDRIGAWEKLKAWVDAGQLTDIAELATRRRQSDQLERAEHAARGGHGEPGQLTEFTVDEIALAAGISRVAASHRLDLAQDLTAGLPQVLAALTSGSIDLIRARIITAGTRSLDPDLRVAVADAVLTKAPAQTPSTLRAAVARAVHIIDPSGVEDRHQADLADRRVTLTPRENGMSELWAFLPADGAAAIMATLHRLAEASHTPADRAAGDRRSADQRRADALIDLATGYLDTHPGLHPTPTATPSPAGTSHHPAAAAPPPRPAAPTTPAAIAATTRSATPATTNPAARAPTRRPRPGSGVPAGPPRGRRSRSCSRRTCSPAPDPNPPN